MQFAMAPGHAQPRFADCKACGKLTLQSGKEACRDRNDCHGVIVQLLGIAETEHHALACRQGRQA